MVSGGAPMSDPLWHSRIELAFETLPLPPRIRGLTEPKSKRVDTTASN
jgi:hypothetical protein